MTDAEKLRLMEMEREIELAAEEEGAPADTSTFEGAKAAYDQVAKNRKPKSFLEALSDAAHFRSSPEDKALGQLRDKMAELDPGGMPQALKKLGHIVALPGRVAGSILPGIASIAHGTPLDKGDYEKMFDGTLGPAAALEKGIGHELPGGEPLVPGASFPFNITPKGAAEFAYQTVVDPLNRIGQGAEPIGQMISKAGEKIYKRALKPLDIINRLGFRSPKGDASDVLFGTRSGGNWEGITNAIKSIKGDVGEEIAGLKKASEEAGISSMPSDYLDEASKYIDHLRLDPANEQLADQMEKNLIKYTDEGATSAPLFGIWTTNATQKASTPSVALPGDVFGTTANHASKKVFDKNIATGFRRAQTDIMNEMRPRTEAPDGRLLEMSGGDELGALNNIYGTLGTKVENKAKDLAVQEASKKPLTMTDFILPAMSAVTGGAAGYSSGKMGTAALLSAIATLGAKKIGEKVMSVNGQTKLGLGLDSLGRYAGPKWYQGLTTVKPINIWDAMAREGILRNQE